MQFPKHIFWDWNGTLLDDTDICLEGINRLLAKRQLALLDKLKYREIFTFPVRDYYAAAGFCFQQEPFEVPAEEFIVEYKELLPGAALFPDVKKVLSHFREMGIQQYIVSAMEQHALETSVEERGISHYFKELCGIENNLAFSKVHRGITLLEKYGLNRDRVLMVGDTLHDKEVATELGVDVVLVGRGHQSRERLSSKGCPVLQDLLHLIPYLAEYA